MKSDELKRILKSEIETATGFIGGQLSADRRQALEYYYGDPFGTEQEGRSQVVMTEVRDVVESILPGLIEVFVAGDEVVKFEPVMPEDEGHAAQATKYVNHIFLKQNRGYKILYDWFKDALIAKNGIVKCWWEPKEETETYTMSGLSEDELIAVTEEDEVDVLEHTPHEDFTHDVKIRVTKKRGRLKVVGVPPEEFLIARRATNMEDASFVAHRVKKHVWELVKEGFKKKDVLKLGSADEHEHNEERTSRFQTDDEWPYDTNRTDEEMRVVWVVECYLRVDWDGDGIAELRRVTTDSKASVILENIEVDEIPLIDACAVPIPHKFFGLSMADFTMDLQEIKSTVMRQLLDNMYLVNNGRTIVNDTVNLDDLLTNRPGQIVRSNAANVSNAVMPITTQSLGQYAYPLLEYLDTVREVRTGVTRYNQGLDADALNKTATGIQIIQSMAQKRQQLIARNLADSVAVLFKKMLRLVVQNQNEPEVIRLRNQWVQFDPRPWNVEMDVATSVGLGHGTLEAKQRAINEVVGLQVQALQLQGGAKGPIVTLENIHNALKKKTEYAGLEHTELYFSDPSGKEAPEQPNPDMEKLKADSQLKQAELQQKQHNTQAQMQAKMEEMQLDHQIEIAKLQQDASEFQQEIALKQGELELKAEELRLKREEIAMKAAEIGARVSTEETKAETVLAKTAADIEIARSKAQEKSNEE